MLLRIFCVHDTTQHHGTSNLLRIQGPTLTQPHTFTPRPVASAIVQPPSNKRSCTVAPLTANPKPTTVFSYTCTLMSTAAPPVSIPHQRCSSHAALTHVQCCGPDTFNCNQLSQTCSTLAWVDRRTQGIGWR